LASSKPIHDKQKYQGVLPVALRLKEPLSALMKEMLPEMVAEKMAGYSPVYHKFVATEVESTIDSIRARLRSLCGRQLERAVTCTVGLSYLPF
jgi:hypothetical protein